MPDPSPLTPDPRPLVDPGRYCREVESYLCRTNDGHIVRIVGPSFELVCGWAEQQIPIRVVFGAIDRAHARHSAKRQSRRPLRIEFCEADVQELFDEWSRAVGVGTAQNSRALAPTKSARRLSLVSHIDRVIDRLTVWHEADQQTPVIASLILLRLDDLKVLHECARTARGATRQKIVARLAEIERQLTAALHEAIDPTVYDTLCAEAARDLEPFKQRMPREALVLARRASTDRHLYDHFKLPRIVFE